MSSPIDYKMINTPLQKNALAFLRCGAVLNDIGTRHLLIIFNSYHNDYTISP